VTLKDQLTHPCKKYPLTRYHRGEMSLLLAVFSRVLGNEPRPSDWHVRNTRGIVRA
jgi:hypothetical protein